MRFFMPVTKGFQLTSLNDLN